MQSVSSRIWTRVAVSISCDDNHYTTGTYSFIKFILLLNIWVNETYHDLLYEHTQGDFLQ